MGTLWDSLIRAYASLAVIPIVPFLIIYFGYNYYSKDKKKSIRLAMDITTALLIACVAVLFNDIFGSRFGFFGILLLMLIGAGLLGNLQYRSKGKFYIRKITRAVWRVSFFAMSVLYILFMLIGISRSIWTI